MFISEHSTAGKEKHAALIAASNDLLEAEHTFLQTENERGKPEEKLTGKKNSG